jgi:hypothetical protein
MRSKPPLAGGFDVDENGELVALDDVRQALDEV